MNSYESYLEDIGFVSKPFVNRIKPLLDIASKMCPTEITDIIITNYIKNDLTIEFQSLWFFSDKYCLEAKEFLTKVDLDIAFFFESVKYWNIKLENYNYKKAFANSKILLEVGLLQGVELEFRAEGRNCDYLRNIINKYIKPNLV